VVFTATRVAGSNQEVNMPKGRSKSKPTIAVTIGDPSGIGPEVIVKALADESLRSRARFIIYGINEPLAAAAAAADIRPYWIRLPQEIGRRIESGVLLADFDDLALNGGQRPRHPTIESGAASMRFLDTAINDCQSGTADALVTGPINKTAWQLAGFTYPGHTELLAHRYKTRRVSMMFTGGPLRVALASIHVGLFDLRNQFTIGLVFQPMDLLNEALRDWFSIPNPRIAVCGLNPHAGEGGRFGDEEARVIEPAIVMAREAGIDASGPYPADSLFWRASKGEFDGVVAMYHDQGLIPIKLLSFDESVNVTLGLPIIRTSVDHGTAFDIAGKNKANPGSMRAALTLAVELMERKATPCTSTIIPGGPQRNPIPEEVSN